jgi:hypothetical protein
MEGARKREFTPANKLTGGVNDLKTLLGDFSNGQRTTDN